MNAVIFLGNLLRSWLFDDASAVAGAVPPVLGVDWAVSVSEVATDLTSGTVLAFGVVASLDEEELEVFLAESDLVDAVVSTSRSRPVKNLQIRNDVRSEARFTAGSTLALMSLPRIAA